MAQSTGAGEYTDCLSAEGSGSSNECPGYDTKQLMVSLQCVAALENGKYPFIAIGPKSTPAWSGSAC